LEKKRLDILLVERGLAPTREKARAIIMAGEALVNDTPATKPGTSYPADVEIRLRSSGRKYVSRGGHKLEGALDAMRFDPSGLDVIDIGASTGGFTDCLLQRGARSVHAVDVGYGQLALSLRNDPRVTVIERVNARNLDPADFPFKFDLAVIDASFISLLKILPAVMGLLKSNGAALALVKPQFEAGRERAGKGVVRRPETHIEILKETIAGAEALGFHAAALCHSPLPGPKGNIEFFALLRTDGPADFSPDIVSVVSAAHSALAAPISVDT